MTDDEVFEVSKKITQLRVAHDAAFKAESEAITSDLSLEDKQTAENLSQVLNRRPKQKPVAGPPVPPGIQMLADQTGPASMSVTERKDP